jgi:hypothetical protein
MGRKAPQVETAGSDSFLDVVTNIVGILIILVMVVGERARHTLFSAPAPPDNTAQVLQENARKQAAVQSVQTEVLEIDQQMKQLSASLDSRRQERELLAALIAASRQELDRHRAELDEQKQQSYDAGKQLALAEAELSRLTRLHEATAEIKPASLKVESYPTPLAKPVDDKELHLQLRGGRVAVVPVDELVDRLKNTAKDRLWKLKDYPEMTDTIGPVDGFRMRYKLVRVNALGQVGRDGTFVQLDLWELIPVSSDLGETLEEALSPTSRLRAKLDNMHPRQWTVTLWVYPDSFDLFRALRKEFYTLGYHVAGRPLPTDVPIGGSPRGTKSAAQ